MLLAIMIIGIVGWVETGNGLFMATAILGGIMFGLNLVLVIANSVKDK
jgi:preprotein translocase subunit SecG